MPLNNFTTCAKRPFVCDAFSKIRTSGDGIVDELSLSCEIYCEVRTSDDLGGAWARYSELLDDASGTTVISKKEFRHGLGAVVKSNSGNINLTGSRVDDNGVLRIVGGVSSSNWNLQTQNDFFEFVHGLWSQTHRRSQNSTATEPAINSPSTHDGASGSETWGFTTINYTGGPGDDFYFEYAYTVNTTTNYLTLSGLPNFSRYDTRAWKEKVQFTTKNGASFPTTTPQIAANTTYQLGVDQIYDSEGNVIDNIVTWTSTNGEFQVDTLSGTDIEFTNSGSGADSLWIKTPWAKEVYVEEVSGDVSYDTFSFRIHVRGDSDMGTSCEVRYRRHGETTWMRAADARAYRARNDYEAYRWHISGCVMRLSPNTKYDIQFTLNNSDGVYLGGTSQGTSAVIQSNFRTRMRPVMPTGGTTHTPTTVAEIRTLLGCAGTSGTTASAGDIIKITASDFSDSSGTNKLDGISVSGTELSPILIQGVGSTSILPRLVFADNADWLTFSDLQIRNWYSSGIGATDYLSVFGVKAICDSEGIVFQNCEIRNPNLPTDVHSAASSGERYDGHGGFILGGANSEDTKWWLIEDCLVELGTYPEFDSVTYTSQNNSSSVKDSWTPGMAFDNRTRSSVISFCRFNNLYEAGYGHSSGSGGGNVSLHNIVDHTDFYSIYDDLYELDHSEGGNLHHHCKSWHGSNFKNTNINGVHPPLSQWHWRAQPRYYDQYNVSNAGTTDGYNSWDITFQNQAGTVDYLVSASGNDIISGHTIRQRNYKAYTLSSGDTINCSAHGFSNGDRVCFIGSQASAVPTELTAETYSLSSGKTDEDETPTPSTFYYVINANTNDFQISATSGGSAITSISDPGASGRYVADVDFLFTWAVRRRYSDVPDNTVDENGDPDPVNRDNLKCEITTRLSGSYSGLSEYNNTSGPDSDFPILFSSSVRSSFAGYRLVSAQDDDTGSTPNWLVNSQHTGAPNQSSKDAGFKWRGSVNHCPLNVVGTSLQTQYKNSNMHLLAKQSAYWASSIWLRSSGGYFQSNIDSISGAPTDSLTVGGTVKYNYWDRNAYFNIYATTHNKSLIGASTIASMYSTYGIDQNSVELLIPSGGDRVSDDLDNVWQQTNVATSSPEAGFWGPTDFGTRSPLVPKDTGDCYDAGPIESDMPGIENLSGPFLDNTDTGNVSFLTTKTNNRRDIGPIQNGLGDMPTGVRSFVDFLSFYLPDGWSIQSPGSNFSSLGVTSGTGTERVIVANSSGTAAILVEHEDID